MNDGGPLLEVTDLRVEYAGPEGGVRAVDGVSFSLRAGETLGIVGASGAGKSSALMSVPRLLPRGGRLLPGSSVRLRGREVTDAGPGELRRLRGRELGLLFQQPGASLNPVHRAGRAVAEAARVGRGLSGPELEAEVIRLLERAGLDDPERAARAYPHELSGGMQQRVALAAAVAAGPSLLLADEPTAALDVVVETAVLERLADLQREAGMATVLVSHDLRVVAGVADRVAVMRAGRVVEEGPTARVLRDPEHPYSRRLLESAPRLDRAGRERGTPSAGTRSAGAPAPGAGRSSNAGGPETGPLLHARGLSRRYGGGGPRGLAGGAEVAAVEDVSLELDRGEAVGLVGRSGSGKSTLARMLTGGETPDEGEIRWEGRALSSMDRSQRGAFRRSAQLLHQDPFASLNPRLTVGRALAEPLRVHGLATTREAARRRAAQLLGRVRLGREYLDRRPGELSGGERQRVALARALTVDPALLAADEPVSALDVSVQAEVLDLLAELREEAGLALLLVAHDLAVVRQVCDRVLVMERGRIVEEGDADEVVLRPGHPAARRLSEAAVARDGEFP